jgi:hypothetical protein
MSAVLNRRTVFVAIAAFVLALAVAYALGSTGEASEGSGDSPGSAATSIDVPSSVAGQSSLGDAAALPALVARPQPEPEPEPEPDEPSAPATETPVIVTPDPPVVVTPDPPAPPPPPPPEVEFDDSG